MGRLDRGIFSSNLETIKTVLVRLMDEFNGNISFGHPATVTDSDNGRLLNVEGSWVVLTLTNAGGTVSCVHNLGITPTPVAVGANSAFPANVRWIPFGLEYGDKTGANAAPAAPAAFVFNLYRKVNETMTSNAITLRYLVTGILPSATEPLTVTLFFTKALN